MILNGDSLEVLKTYPDNHFDSVVTDPPYGLAFMGKKWDYDVPSVELWREVLRVLKPGGHLLSFGGTRTYHRMVVNIEDAGFEIRDQLQWIYGSGFPKSQDISKAIDKQAGVEREVVRTQRKSPSYKTEHSETDSSDWKYGSSQMTYEQPITAPATDAAKEWQGWGTALKPANEPIVLARKPIEKGLTIAENVQKYGTGALNIDGSRIGTETISQHGRKNSENTSMSGRNYAEEAGRSWNGRWPANALFDEEASNTLPIIDGESVSRYFYVAKASKRERNAGLEGMPEKTSHQNFHPTVKPVTLMEYLVRMVTPPVGLVLDPFMGSGTTGVAAKNLGFQFIGIEREAEYVEIAKRRIG